MMAQWLKDYLNMQQDLVWPPVHILGAPFPILLPTCGIEKQQRMAHGLVALHNGNPEEALDSCTLDHLSSGQCSHMGRGPGN